MKLQKPHGNISRLSISAKVASRLTVTLKKGTELNEATENINTIKSTINLVRVFEKWRDEKSLEKNWR